MDGRKLLVLSTICTALLYSVEGQSTITFTIGFGQMEDVAEEGETNTFIRIRLSPSPLSGNLMGHVVPLTVDQFESYVFNTTRDIPQEVQQGIDGISDPAEYEEERKDFNNSIIYFTIPAGDEEYDIPTDDIIINDGVNEAQESLIVVLEIDNVDSADTVALDEQFEGILIFTINDNDEILVDFEPTVYTFQENDGTVTDIINIIKDPMSPPSEVNLTLRVLTVSGSATVCPGEDALVASCNASYVLGTNEMSVTVAAITIVNDISPEAELEQFTLSLIKGDGSEPLNFFPRRSGVTLSIVDDDVAFIGFDMSVYTVTEGESPNVEVCITLTKGQSLNTSSAFGNFTITVSPNNTEDYDPAPVSNKPFLVIKQGQERDCTNITIHDDIFVETVETFNVTLSDLSNTFGAGVNITQGEATVEIEDDDGAVVGFDVTSYTADEGGMVEVCVSILSPNETVLMGSNVHGEFNISYYGGQATDEDFSFNATYISLDSTVTTTCFNISIDSDGLVEGVETFKLTLALNTDVSFFGIRALSPDQTQIAIQDRDFATIGFEEDSYTVMEAEPEGTVMICVELISGVIAPGYSLNYTLELDDGSVTQVLTVDEVTGNFLHSITRDCIIIRVQNNDQAEAKTTATLMIVNTTLNSTQFGTKSVTIDIMDDDFVTVRLEQAEYTISEGASVTLFVAFDGNLHQMYTVPVTISVVMGTANGSDYTIMNSEGDTFTALPETIHLSSNNKNDSLTVTAVDDNIVEATLETLTLSISVSSGDINTILGPAQSSINIENIDVARFSFDQSMYQFDEDAGNGLIINIEMENSNLVVIENDISVTVTVNSAESNATLGPAAGEDYIFTRDLDFTFREGGQFSLQLSFDLENDLLVEGHEVAYLSLTQPMFDDIVSNGAILGTHSSTRIVIVDDDTITVGFNESTYTTNEEEMVEICVGIFDGILGPGITLDYLISAPRVDTTLNDTATATSTAQTVDGDYVRTNFRVMLSAMTTSRCVSISLVDDTIVEAEERFLVQVEQIISSDDLTFGLDPEFTEVTILDNDEIMLGFEYSQFFFNESGDQWPTIYIVRENEVTVSTSFSVIVMALNTSTATDGVDFSIPNATVDFGGDDVRRPFSLQVIDDEVGEGEETIQLSLTTSSMLEGVVTGVNAISDVIIVEDDFIGYRYTQTDYSFSEGDSSAQVCLQITTGTFPPEGSISFALSTRPLSATDGTDYVTHLTPPNGTLTNDTREVCFNIMIVDDNLVEGMETLIVHFDVTEFEGSFSLEGKNDTVITILDNDVAEVGFISSLYTVEEGAENSVTVCVTILSGDITNLVSFEYNITSSPNTATENADYEPTVVPYTDILSLSESTACHSITIYDDEAVEPPETFRVSITPTGPNEFLNLFNVTVGETVVQIVDNDSVSVGFRQLNYIVEEGGLVELCVFFRGPLKNDSFVELSMSTVDGTAGSSDYVSQPVPDTLRLDINNTEDCVTVNTTDDNIVEGLETFHVEFNETDNSEVMIAGTNRDTVTIEDNDVINLEFEFPNYTFSEDTSVSSAQMAIVIANYDDLIINNAVEVTVSTVQNVNNNATERTMGGGMFSDRDYEIIQINNLVTILSDERSSMFQIDIEDDDIVEGIERFTLGLSSGSVRDIDQGRVSTDNQQTVVFIEDNDVVTIGFTHVEYSTSESNTTVCVAVQNGQLEPNVTVTYTAMTINNSASVNDYDVLSEQGQLSESDREYCHSISIIDDDLVEPREALLVELLPEYNVADVQLSPNITAINIFDTDAVSVGFEMAQYSISEEMDTPPLTIRIVREDSLISTQSFSVIVNIDSSSDALQGTDFRVIGGIPFEIMFGPMDMSKEFNVSTLHDIVGEGDETIVLNVIPSSGNVINVESMQNQTRITIIEDDMILVSFTESSYTVSEGDVVEVCVEIVSGMLPFGGFVDLTVFTSSDTATGFDDYTSNPDPHMGTLHPNISVTCFNIFTTADTIVEGTEMFTVTFTFTDQFGAFFPTTGGNVTTVSIIDDDVLEIGFEHTRYEVGEESRVVSDVVYIVKMNSVILQMNYMLTIEVVYEGNFSATLDVDFQLGSTPPLTTTFQINDTRIPLPITLVDDTIEEGYEDFTFVLLYNMPDPDRTVDIVTPRADVFIKDDDVVVIGFERSTYVVFEGQQMEICVSILDRELTNDEERHFEMATRQLADNFALANSDYHPVPGVRTFISRTTTLRRCFTFVSIDDDEDEQPEQVQITGTAISHLIEFNPASATVWIVDDDSLLLPVPVISDFNCSGVTQQTTLTVTCAPVSMVTVAQLLCSVDGETLTECGDVNTLSVTVDLTMYSNGLHVLEILGLTQVVEMARDTVEFYGAAEAFRLDCDAEESSSGKITITCSTSSVLQSLTCTVDQGTPEQCALRFVLDPNDYDEGIHSLVVTATNVMGQTDSFLHTFASAESAAQSIWDDREFVIAIAVAAVALLFLLLLLLVTCILIYYCRRFNRLTKYSIDVRSENEYVTMERNLSFREHENVELVDYTPARPSIPAPQPTQRTRSQSPQQHPQQQQVSAPSEPKSLAQPLVQIEDSDSEEHTEQQLLQATGGERRGLKIGRRHSVETGRRTRDHDGDSQEFTRGGSFGGFGQEKQGKEAGTSALQREKEWEDEMERELEREMALERERERERARMRERRREMEQRERRREREQRSREQRAREREERERQRDRARERRLESEGGEKTTAEVYDPPESYL